MEAFDQITVNFGRYSVNSVTCFTKMPKLRFQTIKAD